MVSIIKNQKALNDLINKIKKIFAKDKASRMYFRAKKKQLNQLKEVILPQDIWLAFLLPNDIDKLNENKIKIDEIAGENVFKLKEKALDILKNNENFEMISKIKDPFDPISEAAVLTLLEIINYLNQKKIQIKDVKSLHVHWIAIAENFGLWRIRYILEDLVFSIIDSKNYELITSLLTKEKHTHEKLFKEITSIVEYSLKKANLRHFKIIYRKKNTYGIYRKMQIKGKNINHITDLFAIRIVVNTEQDCYKALDVLHNLWRPYKNKIKDYIKNPKNNEYQSIHTTLSCLNKKTVEFQIRNRKMDYVANFGPASHKLYKSFN